MTISQEVQNVLNELGVNREEAAQIAVQKNDAWTKKEVKDYLTVWVNDREGIFWQLERIMSLLGYEIKIVKKKKKKKN